MHYTYRHYFQVADCMKEPWVPLLAIGGQLPAVIMLGISAERVLAVFNPIFYRAMYNNKHRSWIIVSCAAFVIGALLCAYGQRLIFGGMNQITDPACFNAEIFATVFQTFSTGPSLFLVRLENVHLARTLLWDGCGGKIPIFEKLGLAKKNVGRNFYRYCHVSLILGKF